MSNATYTFTLSHLTLTVLTFFPRSLPKHLPTLQFSFPAIMFVPYVMRNATLCTSKSTSYQQTLICAALPWSSHSLISKADYSSLEISRLYGLTPTSMYLYAHCPLRICVHIVCNFNFVSNFLTEFMQHFSSSSQLFTVITTVINLAELVLVCITASLFSCSYSLLLGFPVYFAGMFSHTFLTISCLAQFLNVHPAVNLLHYHISDFLYFPFYNHNSVIHGIPHFVFPSEEKFPDTVVSGSQL